MTKFYQGPPSVEVLFGQFVEWFARNLSCKITLTVLHTDGSGFTETYDARKSP